MIQTSDVSPGMVGNTPPHKTVFEMGSATVSLGCKRPVMTSVRLLPDPFRTLVRRPTQQPPSSSPETRTETKIIDLGMCRCPVLAMGGRLNKMPAVVHSDLKIEAEGGQGGSLCDPFRVGKMFVVVYPATRFLREHRCWAEIYCAFSANPCFPSQSLRPLRENLIRANLRNSRQKKPARRSLIQPACQ